MSPRRFSAIIILLASALAGRWQLAVAQESTSKAKPSRQGTQKTTTNLAAPDPGTLRDGTYRNATFGFSYKVPISWVDRTVDMRQDSSQVSQSQVLLAAFSRPPEAAGESINAAVIIAAESVSNYPGLKRAAEYFEPLTAATTSKGFTVVNQPYEFSAGTKLLVRSDFSREQGPQKMYQSSIAMLQNGYIVSFTIVAANQDEAEALLKNLSFGTSQASPHRK
jgi:hypothetical protein